MAHTTEAEKLLYFNIIITNNVNVLHQMHGKYFISLSSIFCVLHLNIQLNLLVFFFHFIKSKQKCGNSVTQQHGLA